jgi:hypothetical protein
MSVKHLIINLILASGQRQLTQLSYWSVSLDFRHFFCAVVERNTRFLQGVLEYYQSREGENSNPVLVQHDIFDYCSPTPCSRLMCRSWSGSHSDQETGLHAKAVSGDSVLGWCHHAKCSQKRRMQGRNPPVCTQYVSFELLLFMLVLMSSLSTVLCRR